MISHRKIIEPKTVFAVSILVIPLFAIALSSASVSYPHGLTNSNTTVEWSRTFGGLGDDIAYSVTETSDGGYALAGYTTSYGAGGYDFWLIRTNSSGSMLWSRTYGGADWDIARSMVLTDDEGYALAGYTNTAADEYDFWLVKTDSTGELQWSNTYGDRNTNDLAYSVIQTFDGGYALAGFANSSRQKLADFFLVKTDTDGNLQWSRVYGGTSDDVAYSVVQTNDGGYAIAGSTRSSGNGDLWLVKTDLDGQLEWSQTYGGADTDVAYSVVQTSNGEYALAGYTRRNSTNGNDFYLVKTNSAGNVNWTKTYGGSAWDVAYSLTQTIDGGYALAGYTASYGVGSQDFWLVETDKNGNAQWNMTYGGPTSEMARCVIQPSNEGYALVGNTDSFGAGANDFWLVKVAPQLQGDINGDGTVDVYDLFILGEAYGSDPTQPNWAPNADINNDDRVDLADLRALAKNYGKSRR